MSEGELAGLPGNWSWITLDRVLASIEAGKSFTCDERPPRDGEVGVVKVSAVTWGEFDESESKTCTDPDRIEPRFFVQPGDFLFSRANTINLVGACVIVRSVSGRLMLSDKILRLRFSGVEPKWVLYALRTEQGRREIERLATGNQESMRNIGQDRIKQIRIPLAPLSEQTRIVAEIDKQLTDLDVGVAALKRVQVNLKRYRASVLKAACEGRFVPTEAELARVEGRDYEPADKLLERILKERRANGVEHGSSQAEPSGLFPLPRGWLWTKLGCVLADIQAGKSFKCVERPPQSAEVGVVKVSAVTWGKFNEEESKTCTNAERIDPNLYVREGDFLFSRANTIELVGACAIAGHPSKKVMLSDKILRFQFVYVDPRWILWVLRSQYGRHEIERLATGNQESMRNIGQERIRQIRIPLPPLAEQRRIVADIERRFSMVEKLEDAVGIDLKRAERLRRSVLKRAFEGKLVPQDPNDKPATVLLERIRQERASPTIKSAPEQMSLGLEKSKKPRAPRRRSAST